MEPSTRDFIIPFNSRHVRVHSDTASITWGTWQHFSVVFFFFFCSFGSYATKCAQVECWGFATMRRYTELKRRCCHVTHSVILDFHSNVCLSARCSLLPTRQLSPSSLKMKKSHNIASKGTSVPPRMSIFPQVSTNDIYSARLKASPQSIIQTLIHKRGRSLHKMAGLTGSSSISQVLTHRSNTRRSTDAAPRTLRLVGKVFFFS